VGEKPPRRIVHLDLDSFFASAEALDNPALRGLPLVVGGLGPRGVVSTASYEARAFGVRSGMPMGRARALCPEAVYLPGRYERYRELSEMVMAVFHRYTPLVEPLSLDEAFLDLTLSQEIFGPAEETAARIRAEVRAETGLTVSAGVSAVKYVAKVASGFRKPDAMTVVPEGAETGFLWPLPLKKLWGAGEVTVGRLEALGLKTIGDVAALPEEAMVAALGSNGGSRLWNLAWGRDLREVEPEREAKSIGAEDTYDQDVRGEGPVRRELLHLSVRVAARLRNAGLAGTTLTLKLRDPAFKTVTRSRTQEELLDDHAAIYALAEKLRPRGAAGPFRLLGIQVSGLVRPSELSPPPPRLKPLFDTGEPPATLPRSDPRLVLAMDDINTRFGEWSVMPATLLDKPRRHRVPETLPARPDPQRTDGESAPVARRGTGPAEVRGVPPARRVPGWEAPPQSSASTPPPAANLGAASPKAGNMGAAPPSAADLGAASPKAGNMGAASLKAGNMGVAPPSARENGPGIGTGAQPVSAGAGGAGPEVTGTGPDGPGEPVLSGAPQDPDPPPS
jgi:DNA polymerase-4